MACLHPLAHSSEFPRTAIQKEDVLSSLEWPLLEVVPMGSLKRHPGYGLGGVQRPLER